LNSAPLSGNNKSNFQRADVSRLHQLDVSHSGQVPLRPDYLSPSLSRSIFLAQTITIYVLIFPPAHGRHFWGHANGKETFKFRTDAGRILKKLNGTKERNLLEATNLLRKSTDFGGDWTSSGWSYENPLKRLSIERFKSYPTISSEVK
jgi:hypothetical protein